jgi:hypothetical protein
MLNLVSLKIPPLRRVRILIYDNKQKSGLSSAAFFCTRYLYFFSHFWFASVQDVLHADWQDVWHSPQPVFSLLFLRLPFTTVLICFMR